MRWLKIPLLTVAAAAVAGAVLRLLNPLPSLGGREASRALPTPPAMAWEDQDAVAAMQAGQSGFHLLADGPDAFATRVLLARSARRSIDAQYYIWHDDLTGGILFDELLAAAERGVRVRLLLDDNNTAGLDPLLARLNAHPNIQIRLFNPFTIRQPRLLGWVLDFGRLNHRMHNKSFTVDNQATVVGGRNIGDEYFGTGEGAVFVDLDTLAVGPVVGDTSRDFDRYWNSLSAYPAEWIIDREAARQRLQRTSRTTPEAARYLQSIRQSETVAQLAAGTLPLTWAPATLVSDDPAKARRKGDPSLLLITRLEEVLGVPRERLGLVAGYFVPTDTSSAKLLDVARRGVRVEVVTNSFAATDVPVVHSGYADDRKALLRGGVGLWELKPSASGERRNRSWRGGGSGSGSGSSGEGGASGVPQGAGQALHAKTFTVDGERLFIGSFNFDPRSARLNTELGFVIDSPELTRSVEDRLAQVLPQVAYQVRLTSANDLEWMERRGDRTVVHSSEPGTTVWSRAAITVLSWLPVEWLL